MGCPAARVLLSFTPKGVLDRCLCQRSTLCTRFAPVGFLCHPIKYSCAAVVMRILDTSFPPLTWVPMRWGWVLARRGLGAKSGMVLRCDVCAACGSCVAEFPPQHAVCRWIMRKQRVRMRCDDIYRVVCVCGGGMWVRDAGVCGGWGWHWGGGGCAVAMMSPTSTPCTCARAPVWLHGFVHWLWSCSHSFVRITLQSCRSMTPGVKGAFRAVCQVCQCAPCASPPPPPTHCHADPTVYLCFSMAFLFPTRVPACLLQNRV